MESTAYLEGQSSESNRACRVSISAVGSSSISWPLQNEVSMMRPWVLAIFLIDATLQLSGLGGDGRTELVLSNKELVRTGVLVGLYFLQALPSR